MERKQQVGDCWVVLYSFHAVNKGFEGHQKILVLDPMLGWADPPMVLCMIFTHGIGHNGFSVHGIGCFGMYKYVL